MSYRHACVAVATIAIALASSSSVGRAQENNNKPITKERQLEICIASFEEAQLKQKRGKVVFARKLFNDCSSDVCPKPLREDCARHRDDIERAIPTATLVVRDASGKAVDAAIKVDGQPFVTEPGRATPIDPGEHDVEYTPTGASAPLTSKITIIEGEKSRVIVLPPPGGGASANTSGASSPTAPAAEPKSGIPVGPILVGSVGVLVLLGSVGMFIAGGNEADDRDKQRALANSINPTDATSIGDKDAYNKSADSHDKASKNDQLIGGLLAAGGGVLLGVAIVWYFVSAPSKTSSTGFAPLLSTTLAGTSFTASF